jgi:F-type H+-transporting ATPase subunit a
VTINWNGKRRYIALLLLIAGIVVMLTVPPIIPVIQLPGEAYPAGWSIFGLAITNTLMSSVVVWILLGLLAWYIYRAMPKSISEVPRGGFYNIFEMLYEGLYGFIANIAGEKYIRYIFSFFMTIFLIVILSNWQALIPGVDSIGFLHPHVVTNPDTGEPENEPGYEVSLIGGSIYSLNPRCPWVSPAEAATYTEEQQAARAQAGCVTGSGAPVVEAVGPEEPAAEGAAVSEASATVEAAPSEGEDAAPLTEADVEAAGAAEAVHEVAPGDPSVPWVVLPFIRPASTDLNMTAALALIAVVMVQVLGFRALGLSYLTKFFNFKTLFTSPLGGIDVAVGLLELIGEFARILSFAFRLLGNVFAGSVLLFVMSFLLPFLPWPFFILEFFVGALQAFVFGLLTAIFMSLATAGHHGEEHAEAHDETLAEAH